MYRGEYVPKVTDEVVDEGASQAFIPYPDLGANLANVPIYIGTDAFYYAARMGFFPNCNKLYLHVPWIAEHLWNLNQSIRSSPGVERRRPLRHLAAEACSGSQAHSAPRPATLR